MVDAVDFLASPASEVLIPENRKLPPASIPPPENLGYDVYLHVTGGSIESRWVEEFFYDEFSEYLGIALGRKPRIFFDKRELSTGKSYPNDTEDALSSSAVLIAFISARYDRSEFVRHEIDFFIGLKGNRPIIPVRLSEAPLPSQIERIHAADFKKYFVTGSADKYRERSDFWIPFSLAIKDLADAATQQSKKSPYY